MSSFSVTVLNASSWICASYFLPGDTCPSEILQGLNSVFTLNALSFHAILKCARGCHFFSQTTGANVHLTTWRASKQSSYQGPLRWVHCPCWRWSGPIPVRISPVSGYCPQKVSITRHLTHEAVIRWKSQVAHPEECPGYQKTRACSLFLVEIILKKSFWVPNFHRIDNTLLHCPKLCGDFLGITLLAKLLLHAKDLTWVPPATKDLSSPNC